MKDRPRWVIGWAEDDGTAGAHCCTCWDLQLHVARIIAHARQAADYGCEGMMAIHWRTTPIAPTLTALARAGWDFGDGDQQAATTPAGMDGFWAGWGRSLFGGDAGAEAGRWIGKFDGKHAAINGLVDGGARTSDEAIGALFAPLAALEGMRSSIRGAGNLERFDGWCDIVRATRLRVRTWVLAGRVGALVNEAKRIPEADRRREFTRTAVVPLRLELARSHEDLIAAFVRCAKSPGETGTIASIESGSRQRIVLAHDQAITDLLGEPLPAAATIRTTYRGSPRIFVSARNTQLRAGEPEEIRAFVLAEPKCREVKLLWRPLGQGEYRQIPATHRARNAYRVELPPQAPGAVEYFLEATLEDGGKVRWPATAPGVGQTAVAW